MNEERKSLFTLVGELPDVISRLITAEIDRIKVELGYKVKNVGVGVGLMAVAAFVGLFLLGTLITTAILALALVMPAWAAALSVSGVLILVIAILIWLGARAFRKAGEDVGLTDEFRRDVDAFQGMGPYDQR